MLATAEQQLQGLRSEQDPTTGLWTIYDVPVLCTHSDDRYVQPGEPAEVYDEAYLQAAAAHAQALEAEQGYTAPLHLQHHATRPTLAPPTVERVGAFRVRGVRPYLYCGEELPTLFVDWTEIQDHNYERIKRDFPYRSVEINGPHKQPEVLSIALLDHKPPYFKFGNLRISDERRAAPRQFVYAPEAAVLHPTRTYEDAPTAMTDPGELLAKLVGGLGSLLSEVQGAMGTAPAPAPDAAMADEPMDPPPVQPEEGPAEQRMDPEGENPEDDEEKTMAQRQHSAQPTKREQALEGRIAGLERVVRQFATTQTSALDQDLADFRNAGATADDLKRFAQLARDSGPDAARSYAATVREFLVSVPPAPPSFGAAGRELPEPQLDPEAVRAYADHGPEVVERARRFAALYERSSKRHSLEDWIAAHMDPGSFMESVPTTGAGQ